MKLHTTAIATRFDDQVEMTGEESFPIQGRYLVSEDAKKLMSQCKGLHPYFNCLEKAKLVKELKGYGEIVIGGLLVWNKKKTANFGYYFNLPFEFHAWWEPCPFDNEKENYKLGTNIIDISLPGVIEKGMNTIDAMGALIEDRSPFILAGKPLDWTDYEPKYVMKE